MELYALIGKPLTHSFSQKYFREKFCQNGVSADYLLLSLERIGDLKNWIEDLPQLKGFNVTMPYKEAVLSCLNELDNTAMRCGNCNCVKVFRQGGKLKLKGYNTDYYGFATALQEAFDISQIENVAIMGRGGASKTARVVLEDLGKNVCIVSRNPQEERSEISYRDFNSRIEGFQLMVNATPVGMYPNENEVLPIDFSRLTSRYAVFDMIYNPLQTLLLRKAQSKGCPTSNGYRMLCLQAEKSWEIWQSQF